ncbi:1,4-alpha-glucan branching enzyme GlgB [Dermatophilus congolensis]|uniref:1,4-alpha-glucan branching enzyme GlgB n=1 Tax=Dermatophilus congolensis TaxID=1863 RepID=A0AA46BLN3_9MICO|nr:1,4-alpha-glucan branching protein GlgB [Dermatophilus congolensis]STD05000.1 1,4-alpha-glucan branching enzyme GlgB [Dermatophilus congolensis]
MAEQQDTTPTTMELLTAWMPSKRWYTSKGNTPELRRLGGFTFADPAGKVGVEVLILLDSCAATDSSPGVIYHVPITYRTSPLPNAEEHLIGTLQHPQLGKNWVYDGAADPVYVAELLRFSLGGGVSTTGEGEGLNDPARGIPLHTPRAVKVISSRILSGEQSNTSIIIEGRIGSGTQETARRLIVKLFRVLSSGLNPDVVLQSALATSGSRLVPEPFGCLTGTWENPHGGIAQGHLAFAQEFFTGTQDAWRTVTSALATGEDFTARARDLGVATAQVHVDLARVLPTKPAEEEDHQAQIRSWQQRKDAALAAVPELAVHTEDIDAIFQAAQAAQWPDLQRIHGDYHLGQVLDVPERGWVLLDFEGEPLRPLHERNEPDLTMRDVAGMLRSFDYAAGSRAQEAPEEEATAQAWASAAREAFCDGYASIASDPRTGANALVLRALELDKALYEVVYETRNRPAWVSIPTAAVERLASRPSTPEEGNNTVTSSSEQSKNGAPCAGDTRVTDPDGALPVPTHELDLLIRGGHGDPHGVLGLHRHNGGVTFRALRPDARTVTVKLPDGFSAPMRHEHEGVWVTHIHGTDVSDYRLDVTYSDGQVHHQDDPYRFWPTLGEIDLHLIGEGRHEELWRVLGSHIRRYEGGHMGDVQGTSFAVWAPNARAVRVVGSFNNWDGRAHPMRVLGGSGVWELFIPDVGENTTYKYEICGEDGYWRAKADPLARATEVPPLNSSVVTQSHYTWNDAEWIAQREAVADPHNMPMSVYECHLGSWRQGLSYVDAADELVKYVKDLGYTHVEFLPLAEHPYGPSWGYQVTGYYAPTSRFGTPDEFRYLVDVLHQNGIGVIMDWVPAHFPKDAFALGRFDGKPLYEHPDPRRGEHKDWGTYIFDFGRPQVRNFLVANACYWIEEFHVDGLRVDAVASMLYLDYSRAEGEWVPNEFGGHENLEAVQFLQETNATLYRRYPGVVTTAEESTSWSGVTKPTYAGGLGFGLKWNMGWMHDTLGYASLPPVNRQHSHHQITFSMVYQYNENFVLPISHDEVVYGKGSMLRKMPGDRWEQLSALRAYYAYMWSHPGKQLLFMGQEFAQESEWADGRSLDWWLLDQAPHWQIHKLIKDLNHLYTSRPALWEVDHDPAGFQWIDANDSSGNTLSFLRYGDEDTQARRPVVASVVNFSSMEHHNMRIGLPHPGAWREILNTDSTEYGGAGVGNLGRIEAGPVPWHGQPYSATITIQKMSAVWFEPEDQDEGHTPASLEVRGAARPELSNSPVVEGEVVRSDLSEADLRAPRVGRSAGSSARGAEPEQAPLGWPEEKGSKRN